MAKIGVTHNFKIIVQFILGYHYYCWRSDNVRKQNGFVLLIGQRHPAMIISSYVVAVLCDTTVLAPAWAGWQTATRNFRPYRWAYRRGRHHCYHCNIWRVLFIFYSVEDKFIPAPVPTERKWKDNFVWLLCLFVSIQEWSISMLLLLHTNYASTTHRTYVWQSRNRRSDRSIIFIPLCGIVNNNFRFLLSMLELTDILQRNRQHATTHVFISKCCHASKLYDASLIRFITILLLYFMNPTLTFVAVVEVIEWGKAGER